MRHILRFNGHDHHAALARSGAAQSVLLNDAILPAHLAAGQGSSANLRLAGTTTGLHIADANDRVFIWLNGETYEVAVVEPLALYASATAAATGLDSRAPMPGSVVSVPVAIGDIVKPGDTLIVIESMKLEVALKATQPGRVAVINAAAGQSFEKDAILVSLIAEEAA